MTIWLSDVSQKGAGRMNEQKGPVGPLRREGDKKKKNQVGNTMIKLKPGPATPQGKHFSYD